MPQQNHEKKELPRSKCFLDKNRACPPEDYEPCTAWSRGECSILELVNRMLVGDTRQFLSFPPPEVR